MKFAVQSVRRFLRRATLQVGSNLEEWPHANTAEQFQFAVFRNDKLFKHVQIVYIPLTVINGDINQPDHVNGIYGCGQSRRCTTNLSRFICCLMSYHAAITTVANAAVVQLNIVSNCTRQDMIGIGHLFRTRQR